MGALAAQSWPKPNPVADDPAAVQFTWIVRFRHSPSRVTMDWYEELERELTSETQRQIAEGRPTEPSVHVRVSLVDDVRVLVHIELRDAEDPPNAWLSASAWALRLLNAREEIDELQGIPKHFWLIFRDG